MSARPPLPSASGPRPSAGACSSPGGRAERGLGQNVSCPAGRGQARLVPPGTCHHVAGGARPQISDETASPSPRACRAARLLPPRGCPGWRAGPPGHAGVCVPVPQPLAGPHPPMRRQRPLWASWGAVHGSSRYPGAPVLGTAATVGARHQGPWLLEASVSSGVGWRRAPCGPLSGRIDCRTHPVEKPRPAPQRCG